MHAFPAGLKMIAGNSHAFSPQSTNVVYWACAASETFRSAPLARPPRSCANVPIKPRKGFFKRCPTCPATQLPPSRAHQKLWLELHVNFPDCWDGKTLYYDNQKNTAYSVNARCPKGYPVAMPAISLVVRYPLTTTTQPVELSSGGQYSGHADFINTWDQTVLASLVTKCLNAYRHCGLGS
jgi:hypothetical protein